YVVLVRGAGAEVRNEELPDAGVAAAHGVAPNVPVVELAGDGDAFRIRRPNREAHTGNAVGVGQVGAEAPPSLMQGAFRVKVELGVGELRTEAVGVVDFDFPFVPEADTEAIVTRLTVEGPAEKPLRVLLRHLDTLIAGDHRSPLGLREERPD